MNRTRTLVLSAAAGLLLAGCSSSTPTADGRPATACDAKTWPQPIPAVIGNLLIDAVSGPLLCFNIATATAPDGHNALDDGTTDTARWTISTTAPAPGTYVTEHQAVTLQLAARR